MVYTIHLESGKHQFSCSDDETILAAALRANVPLPCKCQKGVCSTCMGQVIDGDFIYPDGRPAAISQQFADMGFALFCCAHPRSSMTIKASF